MALLLLLSQALQFHFGEAAALTDDAVALRAAVVQRHPMDSLDPVLLVLCRTRRQACYERLLGNTGGFLGVRAGNTAGREGGRMDVPCVDTPRHPAGREL